MDSQFGFLCAKPEILYQKLIEKALELFSDRILGTVNEDEKEWTHKLQKVHKIMRTLEDKREKAKGISVRLSNHI